MVKSALMSRFLTRTVRSLIPVDNYNCTGDWRIRRVLDCAFESRLGGRVGGNSREDEQENSTHSESSSRIVAKWTLGGVIGGVTGRLEPHRSSSETPCSCRDRSRHHALHIRRRGVRLGPNATSESPRAFMERVGALLLDGQRATSRLHFAPSPCNMQLRSCTCRRRRIYRESSGAY